MQWSFLAEWQSANLDVVHKQCISIGKGRKMVVVAQEPLYGRASCGALVWLMDSQILALQEFRVKTKRI